VRIGGARHPGIAGRMTGDTHPPLPAFSDSPELSVRQRRILAHARERGSVQVDSLARRFTVTPQTIRRDLNRLCNRHHLQRIHGGAAVFDGVANLGYAERRALCSPEKQRIGRTAAALIPGDCSLLINIGTTTEQVANHLAGHSGLLVISNNLNVINTLLPNQHIRVLAAGGLVRPEDGGIVGQSAADFVARFKVDFAVIGVSALDLDGTLLDFDAREVQVTQSIIANARSVILVADRVKFERSAPHRVCHIGALDYWVTDTPPPAAFLEHCRKHQVTVKIAEPAGD